jgi:hypothetical protein
MLGFVIAVGTELATGKGITCQIFNTVVQKATLTETHALNTLPVMGFAFAVLMITMGTLAPSVLAAPGDKKSAAPSFGPFTAAAELQNSRAAMLGFVALLAVEGVKGSALF